MFRRIVDALRSIEVNRIVVYLTVAVNVTGAFVPIVTDAGYAQLVAPLLGINGIAVMFLRGWQEFEKALYTAERMAKTWEREDNQLEKLAGNRGRVNLPR